MIGSSHCHICGKEEKEIYRYRECPNDPRAYFIIKGSEKILII